MATAIQSGERSGMGTESIKGNAAGRRKAGPASRPLGTKTAAQRDARGGGRQPTPIVTLVARTDDEQPHTAITRVWKPGDVARCRRCLECTAVRGVCLIVAPYMMDDDEAADYPAEREAVVISGDA